MAKKRKITNFITLEFPSSRVNTEIATTAIFVLANQMTPSPTLEDISNIKTAVKEAVENAIIHAYPSSLGIISIKASIFNGNILEIIVKDKGLGIPNINEACRPAFTTVSSLSGIGFTIMEAFMTTVDVHSTPGKGTTVKMQYDVNR